MGGASEAKRHRHQPERLKVGRFQFSFRFAWPETITSRPKQRGDCTPCPVCQMARDKGVTPLSCGHRGEEVLWHSRPCVFAGCHHSLTLDVCGRSVIVNRPSCHSCALDAVDAHPNGLAADGVAVLLGVTRERIEQIEAAALRKLGAKVGCDNPLRSASDVEAESRAEEDDEPPQSISLDDADELHPLADGVLSPWEESLSAKRREHSRKAALKRWRPW